MKYSIIVPVYNVEDYIDKCLSSILNQTYDNYEVIIVNDGTKDNSVDIINKYEKKDKRFKLYNKENGGLSSARNYGLNYVTGDYILFIDSDDYIEKDLLSEVNKIAVINNDDLIKFNVNNSLVFNNIKGCDAFIKLINDPLFVTAWSSAYKTSYFKNNNFKYAEGKLHEDFGLTPLVYLKAKSVSSIDYQGYDYIVRDNSIMTNQDEKKQLKRNEDMIYHFNYLVKETNKLDIPSSIKSIALSFYANAIINRAKDLDGKVLDNYINELNKLNISSYLLNDTLPRKIKKLLFNVSPKTYIKKVMK